MTSAQPGRVTIENDVVFGKGGRRDLKVDVYTPPGELKNAPAVLLVHGGAWRQGDRTQLRGYGVLVGRLGYVCVSTEYRLTGEARWPAQIHDVKAALRWMRANSERLGIDPTKIAFSGNSAGGHLALILAGTQNDPEFEGEGGNAGVGTEIAAAVAFYPPVAVVRRNQLDVGLMEPNATDDEYSRASPLTYVRKDFPPTLFLHGNQDQLVPVEGSFRMYRALIEAGAPAELHVFNGAPHGFDAAPDYGRECASLIDLFLRRHVLAPEASPRQPAGV
jgi:acetyl esterase/lipase